MTKLKQVEAGCVRASENFVYQSVIYRRCTFSEQGEQLRQEMVAAVRTDVDEPNCILLISELAIVTIIDESTEAF